jgi:hypothetical protein
MTSAEATTQADRYSTFVLAIDDLEWTRHWLGKLRCDQLVIHVATHGDVRPKIRIRAVESKTTSGIEPVALSVTARPFKEGIEQAVATLDALAAVLSPASPDPLSWKGRPVGPLPQTKSPIWHNEACAPTKPLLSPLVAFAMSPATALAA